METPLFGPCVRPEDLILVGHSLAKISKENSISIFVGNSRIEVLYEKKFSILVRNSLTEVPYENSIESLISEIVKHGEV